MKTDLSTSKENGRRWADPERGPAISWSFILRGTCEPRDLRKK